MFLFWR